MRLVQLEALGDAEREQWARLASQSADPNVFFEPPFVAAVASSPNIKQPGLLVAERDGAWIGCLPVRPVGPVGLTSWRHAYCDAGTPLVDRGRIEEFAAALVDHLGRRPRVHFLLLWKAIDGEVTEAIRAAAKGARGLDTVYEETDSRAAVRRRDGDVAGELPLKPRRRKEVEKNRRRLSEALGLEPAVLDRSRDREAVEQFLSLEAAGWKGKEGTAMQQAGDAVVFRSVCAGYAAGDRLQLLSLEAEGRPLAMQCNLSTGEVLFNFKVTFDEEYRRFAPGIQLEVETMRIFQEERREQVLDSCADPGNQMMNHLWPDQVPLTTMLVGPSGALGRGAGWAIEQLLSRRRAAD